MDNAKIIQRIIGNHLVRNTRFMVVFCVGVFVNVGLYAYIPLRFEAVTESIIVQYSVNSGLFIDAPFSSLYALPIIGTSIIVMNALLAVLTVRTKKLFAYLFVTISLLVQCLLAVMEIALDRVNV